MQYTSIALSLLAASGAYAAPYPMSNTTTTSFTGSNTTTTFSSSNLSASNGSTSGWGSGSGSGSELRVTLSNIQAEIATQITFEEGVRDARPAPAQGPFQTFELSLGAQVKQQDLRCQALDLHGYPLVAVRGDNVDLTFADGGNGPWTFPEPSKVSMVICDPEFKARV